MLINDWLLRTAPHDMRERLFLVFDVSKILRALLLLGATAKASDILV